MTYDIHVYKTKSDYDERRPTQVLQDLVTKEGALDEGRIWLSDHAVVKVQSSDREFIEVLTGDYDGLEMSDDSCLECGYPYKRGDETHYPECSRIQIDPS